jgi:pimeloyl-ACP methyl ester carboxylesterase
LARLHLKLLGIGAQSARLMRGPGGCARLGVFRLLAATGAGFRAAGEEEANDAVLSIGGDKSLGKELGAQAKLVADDVQVIVLKDTGHWILEERPKETTDALLTFL